MAKENDLEAPEPAYYIQRFPGESITMVEFSKGDTIVFWNGEEWVSDVDKEAKWYPSREEAQEIARALPEHTLVRGWNGTKLDTPYMPIVISDDLEPDVGDRKVHGNLRDAIKDGENEGS